MSFDPDGAVLTDNVSSELPDGKAYDPARVFREFAKDAVRRRILEELEEKVLVVESLLVSGTL